VKTARFEQLRERIAAVLDRYAQLNSDVRLIEGRTAKKDRENSALKKKLESALQEREQLHRKIRGVIDKIEALDI
jgi:chromosome segregation ATPase